MAELAYKKVYTMSAVEARGPRVREYLGSNSIRATARWWHTSRQVVRKWVRRHPVGRKGYNGWVERSHRTDDEEFYRPYLPQVQDVPQFLGLSALGVRVQRVPSAQRGRDGGPAALGGVTTVGAYRGCADCALPAGAAGHD